MRAQAKVIVTGLVKRQVLDPAMLWTDDTRRIPEVASALADYADYFGMARAEVEIKLKSYFMHM